MLFKSTIWSVSFFKIKRACSRETPWTCLRSSVYHAACMAWAVESVAALLISPTLYRWPTFEFVSGPNNSRKSITPTFSSNCRYA